MEDNPDTNLKNYEKRSLGPALYRSCTCFSDRVNFNNRKKNFAPKKISPPKEKKIYPKIFAPPE
jgi:hypothetical protein